MIKKTTVLAGLAVAAIALVHPAIAAAGWTDKTTALTSSAAVSFAGNASFVGELGGVNCTTATATAQLTQGSAAHVTSFGANSRTEKCHTSGGLTFCDLHTVTAESLNWSAHTNTENVPISGVNVRDTFTGAFCPYHEIRLKGTVTATPDNPHAMKSVTLSGTLEASNATTGAYIQNVTAGGTMVVTPSGTYGIT
jgi:hypothetical protein